MSITEATMGATTEEAEQKALIAWSKLSRGRFPQLSLLFHIPNGGLRHPVTARKMQLAGVQAGVPDLCLPFAAKGFHGLYIEMKRGVDKPKSKDVKGELTDRQQWWRDELRMQGYRAEVCYGFEDARTVLEEYLS